MKRYQLYIGGEYVDPDHGEWIDSIDPFHRRPWAQIPRGSSSDAARAVAAAKRAMSAGSWATMTPSDRGRILRRTADLVAENGQRLAEIETRDNGKLLAEMVGQLKYISECWHYYAGLADKIEGAHVPVGKRDVLAYTAKEAVGVVVALTAWNSPLMFAAIKCAPALAAGCTVVVKPSEFASASTIEFAALTKAAGLPDGVFNVVTGFGHEVGSALVEHPDVAKVTFTGSDLTGIKIYEAAARTLKRVSLELGGKSPNIVFDDADLDLAASGVVSGIFGAAGQMCVAGSRLLVQNSIREAFTERLLRLAQAVKLGDPMRSDSNVGPIATAPQYQKVLDYIAVAQADGARCILGGKPAVVPGAADSSFIEPTIFADVTSTMRIAQEEVFGPVLSIIGFEDEARAIEIGNDVVYGLVAGVWTTNIGRAVRMSRALKVGTVWVNTYRTYSYMMPSGGMKRSGIGRESGIEAIHEYLETKSVFISTAEAAPADLFVQR